jgi:hypothetical protein
MAFLKTQERTNGDVRTPYESGTSPAWASGVRHLRIPALTGANACESVRVEIISLHLHRNFGGSVLRSSFSSPVRISTADDSQTLSNCAFRPVSR